MKETESITDKSQKSSGYKGRGRQESSRCYNKQTPLRCALRFIFAV